MYLVPDINKGQITHLFKLMATPNLCRNVFQLKWPYSAPDESGWLNVFGEVFVIDALAVHWNMEVSQLTNTNSPKTLPSLTKLKQNFCFIESGEQRH